AGARDERRRRRRGCPPGSGAGRAPGRFQRGHLAAVGRLARRRRALPRRGACVSGRGQRRRARLARDLSPRPGSGTTRGSGRPRSARGLRPSVCRRHGRADRAVRARGRARRPRRLGGRGAVVRRAGRALPRRRARLARALPARLDTLVLAGLDTAAEAEVRTVLGRAPQQDVDALLAWSDGLAVRGFGPAAVRLGWQAALKAPADPRVLRAIFPWPNRPAVQAEAAEFGVDPFLFVAIVRQESVFDAEALSPAGARGLAQLTPGTAALTARGLDVTFYPDWITVPDLNLHLGAAHLDELLRRFGGRADAAVAAYNAGVAPVTRWLARDGAADVDQFIELIP